MNRRMSAATMRGPLALAKAKIEVLARFRSPSRLAAKVAATTPMTTGHHKAGPNATRTPVATPAAGQNTATPSALSSKARLRRAARKKVIATEIETAHGRHDKRAGGEPVVVNCKLIVDRRAHAAPQKGRSERTPLSAYFSRNISAVEYS